MIWGYPYFWKHPYPQLFVENHTLHGCYVAWFFFQVHLEGELDTKLSFVPEHLNFMLQEAWVYKNPRHWSWQGGKLLQRIKKPSSKLTWLAGKSPWLDRRYIFKWSFFNCYISFRVRNNFDHQNDWSSMKWQAFVITNWSLWHQKIW